MSKTLWVVLLVAGLIYFWTWYPGYLDRQALSENEDSMLYYGNGEYVTSEEHLRRMYDE